MTETFEDIANLVRSLVTPLVDNPDEVSIASDEMEDGSLLIEIRVHEEDAGKVMDVRVVLLKLFVLFVVLRVLAMASTLKLSLSTS